MDAEDLRVAAPAALPALEGSMTAAGLEGPATIRRDADGVPHVRTGSARDAFFARGFVQGFAHAQDRLLQLELNRRRTLGRRAEWLGPAAFAADALARRLGIEAASRPDAAALGGPAQEMIAAYAAGVNAFLASGAPLPVEYTLLGATPEPWEGWHRIAVMRRPGLLMGSVWFKLWRAVALPLAGEATTSPRYVDGGDDAFILPPGAEGQRWRAAVSDLSPAVAALLEPAEADATGGGSNNWVVAGRLTATGRPVLAGDPHRVFELPNMYVQTGLSCAEFDVIGLSVPGFPHFAHNGQVAWCVTHTFADIHGLYLARFDAEGARTEFRVKTVAVRGEAAREVEIVETHHGPVICGDPAPGMFVTANGVVPDDDPDDLCTDCHPPYPAARILELLRAPERRSVEGAATIHADTLSTIARLFQEKLARPPALSPAASADIALRLALTLRLPEASGLGALAGHAWLRPAPPWGEVPRPRFTHPLSPLFPWAAPVLDPLAMPPAGDGDTVQANGLVAPAGPAAADEALARYAFDVGNRENSRWVVFLGASGHQASPHHADQHADWASCRMRPMRRHPEPGSGPCTTLRPG